MFVSPRYMRNFVLALCLLVSASISIQAQDNLQVWESFDFAKTALKPSQIQSLPLDDLKFIRGIVFGRHGRIFKDSEIKYFLESRSWFKANPDFNNAMLNDTERRNLDLIRIAEASKHETIQPGDMRYWRDRPLTVALNGQFWSLRWKRFMASVSTISRGCSSISKSVTGTQPRTVTIRKN